MSKGYGKITRVLSLYDRLSKGSIICKDIEVERFGVNEKTIRRDIEDLRCYLEDNNLHQNASSLRLIYNRKKNGYLLDRNNHSWLTNEEILILSKIVLESRALPKDEVNNLLDKIIMQSDPDERRHIKQVILNERYHYVPLNHNSRLSKIIWDLSYAVREQEVVELEYQKVGQATNTKRVIKPQGIVFSEYYFYLLAYIEGLDYDFPAVYRLDRIVSYDITNKHFSIPNSKRFEEGEFRKRVQFMKPGRLMRIRFRFWGPSLEAVLDRLPTAEVISSDETSTIVEAEVFGHGIKMWLLSQAQYLEVLSPLDFKEEMKRTIEEMMSLYR